MSIAKVTLWGKYVYEVNYSSGMTMEQFAMEIAKEVHRREHKTKFTNHPRAYNYIYECLNRKWCMNFRVNCNDSNTNEKELLKACNDLHNKSEWVKKIDGAGISYYEHQDYRLGYTQCNTLIIDVDGNGIDNDVDGNDIDNVTNVKYYYEAILKCKFKVIETKKGYWLFSDKKYSDVKMWVFDNCRILNPYLKYDEMPQYINGLLNLDNGGNGNFKRATPDTIKSSVFYKASLNISFDVAFQFLSIKRERCTIRITKKGKDDSIREILI